MEDKTIYQKYDELLEANTRLSAMVSMKFTAEQQAYLERVITMEGLDIIKVRGSIYGPVEGTVCGDVFGDVYGDVKEDVWGTVDGGDTSGDTGGVAVGDVSWPVWGEDK